MHQTITIVGNLGRDPELRYMSDGQAVCNLNVATNRRWSDRQTGEPREETCWFRVSVWGRQAEAANEYLEKGRQVLVQGRLRPDPETGGPRIYMRQDGTAGASFEIVAQTVRFLGGRNGHAGGNGAHEMEVETDDIPF